MRRTRRRLARPDRTGVDSLAVLHVAHTGEGGVGKCVADFARDQVARGWRVTVATEPASALAREAMDAGAVILPWVASREPSARLPKEILALRRILAETDPDVVHLHSSKGGLCGRLLIRGRLPTLFQPHGWSFEAAEGLLERLTVGWERFGARWAEATVCVSHAEADRGRQQGIGGPFRVIPNGVDLTRFTQADTSGRREARRRLGLTDQLLVVCVGRLQRAKGQDVLAAAWPTVRDRVPGAELALIGDGEDMERLRREELFF